MTASRNADVLIDAFLAEGITEAPDRVFDAVRGEIGRTRQRVVIGPVRLPRLWQFGQVAAAAALVLVAVLVGLELRVITGPASPVPTPSPSPSPETARLIGSTPDGNLAPGRWALDYPDLSGSNGAEGPTMIVTVPEIGWIDNDGFMVEKATGYETGPALLPWQLHNAYRNGCDDLVEVEPPPGPGVADLLDALATQPRITAGPVTQVTIDGYPGAFVDLTVADDTGCTDGVFVVPGFPADRGDRIRVYALDVDGTRLTFVLRFPIAIIPGDDAKLQQMADTMEIAGPEYGEATPGPSG